VFISKENNSFRIGNGISMMFRVVLFGSLLLAQAVAQTAPLPQSHTKLRLSQASYARGTELAREGHFTQALEEFQKAAELDPSNPKVHNMLGVALSQLGRLTDAKAAFDRALALAPSFYPARKNRATNAFLQRDFTFAASEFKDLAQLQPKDFVPPLFLGLLAIEGSDIQKARERLLRARQLAPDDGRVLRALVRVHFTLGERQLAIEAAREMRLRSKATPPEQFELGVLLASFEANTEAAEVFKNLWQQQPGSYDVGFNLALLQYRSDQPEAALRTVEELISHGAKPGEIWNLQGWIHNRLGRQDQAIASFRQALAAEPARADHYLDLSTVLMNAADWLSAERVVSEGIEKNVEKDRLYVQMGLLYRRNNDLRLAETWYQRALEVNPANEAAYITLAHLLLVAGREGEALTLMEKALKRLPTSALLHYIYGSLLLETATQGETEETARVEKARLVLEKALTLNPVFANTHYRLARLFLLQGDEEKAEKYLERACSLNPKDAEALFQLSRILARRGQKQRAAELRQTVHELHTEKDRLVQELAHQSSRNSPSAELLPKPKD
jgi:Flp pilus assembly protein TadD